MPQPESLPPADTDAPRKSFSALVREGCEAYVLQGIGLPVPAYVFHGVKLVLFVLGWMFFCSFTPGLGSPWHVASWWERTSRFKRPSPGRASSRCWGAAA